jgi:hypothetical protein
MEGVMHMLLIEGIDDELMRSIRTRAVIHQRTLEEEALAMLNSLPKHPGFRCLGEAILHFPNVGLDSDFERVN